mgnify:FL=1
MVMFVNHLMIPLLILMILPIAMNATGHGAPRE